MGNPSENDMFTAQLVSIQRRLYAYILTILPNLADADDVLQETNMVLLRKREEYTPGTDFGAWACRVAYFEVLALRKKQQRERGRILFADQSLFDHLAGEAGERFVAGDQMLLARLERCMKQLSHFHRRLIHYRYRYNILSEQIAERLGRSAAAVRQLLYRIRTRLLRCVQSSSMSEDDE